MRTVVIALISTVFAATIVPAWAQKGPHNNEGRGGPPPHVQNGAPGQAASPGHAAPQGQSGSQGQAAAPAQILVVERDRTTVHTYYRAEFAAGNCPPGLAKKNNGCMPPGLAKKAWGIGQPLPADVIYYPLPPALVLQLTPAPSGYQYVRVANDVLLLATGTRLISAAVADLSEF